MLKTSEELQAYLKESIRGEIAEIGQKVFDEVKEELQLQKTKMTTDEKKLGSMILDDLRESWRIEEVDRLAPNAHNKPDQKVSSEIDSDAL